MVAQNADDPVIPAKAGIQTVGDRESLTLWIPAFAGMTATRTRSVNGP